LAKEDNMVFRDDEILTAKEVAEYLKMNERTIYKLAHNGQIPTIKVAHQWRFRKSMIDSWLDLQMSHAITNNNHGQEPTNGGIKISEILRPGGVDLRLRSETKHEVIKELVELFCANYEPSDREKLTQAVVKREQLCSTAIYDRVALPHPRYNGEHFVREPALVVGCSRDGIQFDSLDGKPTYLFLMLCAPTDAQHLQMMSKICRLLTLPDLKEQLIRIKSIDQMLSLIKKQEELGKI